MMYAAYFDRTTDRNEAVLLVEQLNKNYHVPLSSLPQESEPGSWFRITIENENITSIQLDPDKTGQMQENIQNQLHRLQSNKKSRFKRR